ncbi:hypothetical protein ACHHYP_00691 [Achlya hypogyna]|uniref:SAP domain-containing protein n=1 Tax=Achlya hypogyna TaxID=1202772 RepID=A0A1V9ZU41_ACHHY|nr:hypothetical protein ACHHYP_00691 [Achlya hypogyna]
MPSKDEIDRMTVKQLQTQLQKLGANADLKARLVTLLENETNSPNVSCADVAPTEPEATATAEPELAATEVPKETSTSWKRTAWFFHSGPKLEDATNEEVAPTTAAESPPVNDDVVEPPPKKHKTSSVPPAKNPATCTLRIDNFVRPFTLPAVKEWVQQVGNFVDDTGFWIDSIKTHCYVTFPTLELATATRERLHGQVWPTPHGKVISCDYSAETTEAIVAAKEASVVHSQPKEASKATELMSNAPPVSMDDLFWKTATKPVLYYLPLTKEQVALRQTTAAAAATSTTTSL